MKLGPVKTGHSNPAWQILYPTYYLAVTHSQSFLWHQGLSWTTAYMSPQRCIQEDLATCSCKIK